MKRRAVTMPHAAENAHIRAVNGENLPAIVKLDEAVTGSAKRDYWHELLSGGPGNKHHLTFLLAELDGRVVGFITGNVRAFEFGSEACGWVFALCVDETALAARGSRAMQIRTKPELP